MNDNVQKLIDAGVLKVTDRSQLPQDLVDKVNGMSDDQVQALINLKTHLDPSFLKAYQEFIWM